jgi:hypothetical protein
MLKDAEVYEYVSLEPEYVHHAFDKLPLTATEEQVLSRAMAVKPIVTSRAERYYWLRVRRQQKTITETERIELRALEDELKKQYIAFRTTTTDILKVVASIPDPELRRSEEERQLDKLESIKGVIREAFMGKAAALHYIVSPDHMDAILTTATSQVSYTWRQLDSQQKQI